MEVFDFLLGLRSSVPCSFVGDLRGSPEQTKVHTINSPAFLGPILLVCGSRTLLTGSSASRPLGVNSQVGLVLTGILILKTIQKQGLRLNHFILPIYKDKT